MTPTTTTYSQTHPYTNLTCLIVEDGDLLNSQWGLKWKLPPPPQWGILTSIKNFHRSPTNILDLDPNAAHPQEHILSNFHSRPQGAGAVSLCLPRGSHCTAWADTAFKTMMVWWSSLSRLGRKHQFCLEIWKVPRKKAKMPIKCIFNSFFLNMENRGILILRQLNRIFRKPGAASNPLNLKMKSGLYRDPNIGNWI